MTSRVRGAAGHRCRHRTLVVAAVLAGGWLVGAALLASPATGAGPAWVPAEVGPPARPVPELLRAADSPPSPDPAASGGSGVIGDPGSCSSPEPPERDSAAATGGQSCPPLPPRPYTRADGLSTGGLATGGGSYTGPDTVDPQTDDGELAADELARTSGSAPGDGPIGLLALVATVCLVGVSAGAIRTVVSQRAGRMAVG